MAEQTLGALYVDARFACFTLEDQSQKVKVPGETRIPAGLYELKLRTEGGMHPKYAARFTEHRGMLHLIDVPNFEYIYIHVGLDDDDTNGCILVADTAHADGTLTNSTAAYRRIYGQLANAILAGEPTHVLVEDYSP